MKSAKTAVEVEGEESQEQAAPGAGDHEGFFASIIQQQDIFISYSFFKDAPGKVRIALRFGDQRAPSSYQAISVADLGHLPPRVCQMIVEYGKVSTRAIAKNPTSILLNFLLPGIQLRHSRKRTLPVTGVKSSRFWDYKPVPSGNN